MVHFRSQETVDSALRMSDAGVVDRVNAEIHGVAIKTIRRWRRQYQRRGLPRGQGFRPTPCPRCDGAELDEAAYALLLGWYLGDGHIVAARRGVYTLQISNDQKYPVLNQEIAATIRRVKPTASPCLRGGSTAVRIEARWKHWPCVFPQHGPGRKHLRRIALVDWQHEIVRAEPELLLRGLFHSDGSRFVNWATKPAPGGGRKRYEYIRYMFSNESADIRGILTDALDQLAIPWRQPRVNVVAVSRREGVVALDGFVGPKS
ncbi:transcriptional regulator [Kribbella sp. ALI-6-A]|uniref:transcriptional regulator n=1 Tax=Kribbella sp. ALI-6-A TaxID=1933817 RepID=UPI00097C2C93|nr:transcriptional regulator [Kribbella sp. ALI-6-A]ONI69544.1 transcriptional regulator [Kribbella sp. ALI-6-A]